MDASNGRTVRLFLVDGTSTGVIVAEILNWTGHLLLAPRSRLKEVLSRDEVTRTGVYFLLGDDPDQLSKSKVYIGEGDSVQDRIRSHAVDSSKDFWTRLCIITSKDSNLTKSHVRYLESRFVELAKAAGRANLANGNDPAKKMLPESDVADMEFFIEQVRLILPIIGFDFLRAKATPPSPLTNSKELKQSQGEILELVMRSPSHGYEAHAIESDGEFTVLAGSQATLESFAWNSYAALREQLIKEGRLKQPEGQTFLVFSENVAFSSPSAAAAIISNRNSNGRIVWKLASSGQTLKDWQDSQIS